jgi:hypothetical protein
MKTYLLKLVIIVLIGSVACCGYGTVICFGHDGHIQIEPALHDHCGHSAKDAGHPEQWQSEADACCPCVDVLIGDQLEPVRLKKPVQSDALCFIVIQKDSNAVLGDTMAPDKAETFSFFTPLKTIILLN